MSDLPADRRPIAARELGASKAAAAWMARRGFSANGISIAGMVLGVLGGASLFLTARRPDMAWLFWTGGALFTLLRLLANMFDGMVAIERGTASKVGELFNEVPDRVSDTATLIGLGYAAGGDVLLGFGAALAAMMTAYVRAVGKGAGAPSEFCGPMAKQQRMFLVIAVSVFCAAAPAAWERMPLGCCTPGVPAGILGLILAGSVITVLRRLVRIGARLRGTP